jgi:predicted transcriptional regulator
MAEKERVGYIDIKLKHGAFSSLFRRIKTEGRSYGGLDFSDITALRQLLSNEKARILFTLKNKKPSSLYELAKLLGRDFKSVRKDIELLRNFGFVRFISESKGKKQRLKPVVNLDKIQLTIYLQ